MKPQCVIFDMDGTITEPLLDFDAIRAELGVAPGRGILEALANMPPDRRATAERTLLEHETHAARNATLTEGAPELIERIRREGIALALLTRNTRPAMEMVVSRFALAFDLAWSREDGPIKPSPDSILAACRLLSAEPERTVCVGDWVFDIDAANAAGCMSVLVAHGRQLDFAARATHVIQRLAELPPILGI